MFVFLRFSPFNCCDLPGSCVIARRAFETVRRASAGACVQCASMGRGGRHPGYPVRWGSEAEVVQKA